MACPSFDCEVPHVVRNDNRDVAAHCKCLVMLMTQPEEISNRIVIGECNSIYHLPLNIQFFRSLLACSSFSILPSGKQFTTSSLVSQPLRAIPTPNHRSCKRSVR